jgi:hypothetical protein
MVFGFIPECRSDSLWNMRSASPESPLFFASAQQLACYSGLVPVVHSSGGRTFYGPTSNRSNSDLRWAFIEAAN